MDQLPDSPESLPGDNLPPEPFLPFASPAGEQPPKKRDSFLEISIVVLAALLMALVLRMYVAEAYMIRGYSMRPTFDDGERVMVQKVFYEIQRGDIIIFTNKQ